METRRIYCVVPAELAGLHDLLRRHFRDDAEIDVVIERRAAGDRRSEIDRRASEISEVAEAAGDAERRRIRNAAGRRIADRRGTLVVLDPDESPPLPRRARAAADRIAFVERVVRSSEEEMDADTGRLVTRIQAGESELFSEIYLRYFDRIYGYLRTLLNDAHEAEDVSQQVFLEASVALPRYERRSQPFRAWLFVIARNQAVMRLRKLNGLAVVDPAELDRGREQEASAEAEMPALGWLTDRDLFLFVERLPLAQRQVLVLRYLLDLDMADIAKVLGRSDVDVRALHHRALRFLEKRLAAVGRRASGGERIRMHRCPRPANVLRARRFALR